LTGLGLVHRRFVKPLGLPLPRTGFVRHPDTDLVDDDGCFDEQRLTTVFDRHAKVFGGEALTIAELAGLLVSRLYEDGRKGMKHVLLLPLGIGATVVEWAALFWVASTLRDGTPVLEKESVRRFYTDPGFFDDAAERLARTRASRSQTYQGTARNTLQDWLL